MKAAVRATAWVCSSSCCSSSCSTTVVGAIMATRPVLKVWSAPITASVSLVCMTAFPPLRLRALRASSSSTPSCVRPLPKSSRPCATRVTAPTMPRATWATPCVIAAARLKHSLLPYCAKSVVSSVISANPPASSTPRLSLKP